MHADEPLFVAFHSYKGGSGRTTTCVNIAGALMALGHDVVVIDADLGAGGLRTVCRNMGMPDEGWDAACPDPAKAARHAGDGVHDYLNSYLNADNRITSDDRRRYRELLFRRFDFWGSRRGRQTAGVASPGETAGIATTTADRERIATTPRAGGFSFQRILGKKGVPSGIKERAVSFDGELLFVPGSQGKSAVNVKVDAAHMGRALQHLGRAGLDFLKEQGQERGRVSRKYRRFVLFDSASGLTMNSLPSLMSADIVLQFFRFSSQHHEGTKDHLKKTIGHLQAERARRDLGPQQFVVAGSCEPGTLERKWFGDLGEAVPIFGRVEEAIVDVERFWGEVEETGRPVLFGQVVHYAGAFPEHPVLRHREDLVALYNLEVEQDGGDDRLKEFGEIHEKYVLKCAEVALMLEKEHERFGSTARGRL